MDLLAQALNQLAPKKVGIEEFAESSEYCNKNLYPGQAVLLKTIFLEELTGQEEDILTYWINGGRNGTEIGISPNVRERVEWCREAGYPHFREVALVGGRRSSKGFCTGLAMGKVMWETLQKGDPGATTASRLRRRFTSPASRARRNRARADSTPTSRPRSRRARRSIPSS